MGLCKCPKRKPSNLFCFEHRVNVCDHCLVTHHPRCVVQTYVKWLQDDDYRPECHLCNGNLSQDPVIRLECLDVFHVSCLDAYARNYPATTAPAGYQCPSCKAPLIPPSNHAGPVVDALRPVLARMPWARAALGLPAITAQEADDSRVNGAGPAAAHHTNSQVIDMGMDRIEESSLARRFYDGNYSAGGGDAAVTGTASSHHSTDMRSVPAAAAYNTSPAADSDGVSKYERRSASQWMARFLRSRAGSLPPSQASKRRRLVMMLVIGGLALLTLIIILSRLGRHSTENDPLLDPLANPNIHIN